MIHAAIDTLPRLAADCPPDAEPGERRRDGHSLRPRRELREQFGGRARAAVCEDRADAIEQRGLAVGARGHRRRPRQTRCRRAGRTLCRPRVELCVARVECPLFTGRGLAVDEVPHGLHAHAATGDGAAFLWTARARSTAARTAAGSGSGPSPVRSQSSETPHVRASPDETLTLSSFHRSLSSPASTECDAPASSDRPRSDSPLDAWSSRTRSTMEDAMTGTLAATSNHVKSCVVEETSQLVSEAYSRSVTVVDRIGEALRMRGISARELSKKAGLSHGAVSWMLRHPQNSVRESSLTALGLHLGHRLHQRAQSLSGRRGCHGRHGSPGGPGDQAQG